MLLLVLVTKQQQQQQQIQITIKNSGSKSCEDLKSRKIFKFSYLFLIKQTNCRQSRFYLTRERNSSHDYERSSKK